MSGFDWNAIALALGMRDADDLRYHLAMGDAGQAAASVIEEWIEQSGSQETPMCDGLEVGELHFLRTTGGNVEVCMGGVVTALSPSDAGRLLAWLLDPLPVGWTEQWRSVYSSGTQSMWLSFQPELREARFTEEGFELSPAVTAVERRVVGPAQTVKEEEAKLSAENLGHAGLTQLAETPKEEDV